MINSEINKINVNLQLFAGDSSSKTEKATPKKKQDTRKKGQVFQSREITSAIMLVLIFATLRITGSNIFDTVRNFAIKLISEYTIQYDLFSINTIGSLYSQTVILTLKIIAPIFGSALLAGIALGYAQVGFLFTTEPIAFKFSRLNPISGIKRLFSTNGFVELLKSLLKIMIIGYVSYSYVKTEINNILILMSAEIDEITIYIGKVVVNLAFKIALTLIILGVFDYLYKWWEHEKNLKMSKQEVKEEYKQTEGNPAIKSMIRQKQRQLSTRRMLHSVPTADVIITNPTHYAVAIKYDAKVSEAPVVSAKGQGFIAMRIKEIAKENGIEIVENKFLARTLYESVEIDQSVPPELYQAVAEVLAFVYGLSK